MRVRGINLIGILVNRELDKQEQNSFLRDVDEFCKELRPIEEVCYVEHTFNDQLIPLCKKYGLLGIPVRKEYGGRGADSFTYTRALDRIGMEGTGVRTFFSGHTSLGQVPIQMWGNEDERKRYLPPSTKGEKILAFGLTEPEAGSNPLEMKMTYEDKGSHYVLNGVKYLISNAGIANAIVTFAYPKGGGRVSAFIIDTDKEGILKQDLTTKLPLSNVLLFPFTVALFLLTVNWSNVIGALAAGAWIVAVNLRFLLANVRLTRTPDAMSAWKVFKQSAGYLFLMLLLIVAGHIL